MKFRTNRIGFVFAVLRTKIGERSIALNTRSMAEAELIAKDLNLDVIERAGKEVDISRDLIRRLTKHGRKKVLEAIVEWERWLSATSESENTVKNMTSYGHAWVNAMHLRGSSIDDLCERHVDEWVNADDGTKLSTRKFRLAVATSILKFCCIKKYADVNVAQLVKVKQKPLSLAQKTSRPKRVFTDEEYERVKAHLMKQVDVDDKLESDWARFWYCAVVLGRRTALRLADICCLERSSIQDGKLRVCTDKKNTWVEHEITDEMLTAMAIVRVHRLSKHMFTLQNEIASDPRRRCQLSNRFRQVMNACGIEGQYFHLLRSTAATEIVSKGGSIQDVATALGHGDSKSSEVYVIGT